MAVWTTLKRWFNHGERGSQIVEFGLLLPIFVVIVMMALDGGRLMVTYASLKNAARESAVYLARNPTADNAALLQVATTEGNGFLPSSKMTISTTAFTWGYGGNLTQEGRTVSLNYGFEFVNPVLGITNPMTLNATAAASLP